MQKLDHEKTREILEKLSNKFARDTKKVVNKYLKHKTISLAIISFDIGGATPIFWSPQNNSEKKIHDIYEDEATFDISTYNQINNSKTKLCVKDYFLNHIKTFFKQENISTFYAVGDWNSKDLETHALEFSIDDLPDKVFEVSGFEDYFFPEDMSWFLANTHEGFWFLAGTKDFIDRFRKIYKDYKKYPADSRHLQ